MRQGTDEILIETKDIFQLLPPPGAYNVILSLCDGHSIPMVMSLSDHGLLCQNIGQFMPNQIERIDFV